MKPLRVFNPYARLLTFRDDRTRMRRDHYKYLVLIRTIAFLHQYQRPHRTLNEDGETYVDVTIDDIALANKLAHDVLGRTLDELSPQTRQMLLLLDDMVTKACQEMEMDRMDYRFTRKEIRDHTGWSDYQVRSHMRKLVGMEYALVHHGQRGQSFVYELLYEGQGKDGSAFVLGLVDTAKLSAMSGGKDSGRWPVASGRSPEDSMNAGRYCEDGGRWPVVSGRYDVPVVASC